MIINTVLPMLAIAAIVGSGPVSVDTVLVESNAKVGVLVSPERIQTDTPWLERGNRLAISLVPNFVEFEKYRRWKQKQRTA